MKTIRVTADSEISVVDVDFDDFQSVQNMLGGYVEVVNTCRQSYLFEEVVMLVDEEGLLKELPKNPVGSYLYGGLIVGDVILAQFAGEELIAPKSVEELEKRLAAMSQLIGKEKQGDRSEEQYI